VTETLFVPQGVGAATTSRSTSRGLSEDLLRQAARRMRILALLYAFTFFMAGYFPSLLFAAERAHLLATPSHWIPGLVSIGIALTVAAIAWSERVSLHRVIVLGLVFEVVSSYGIAIAEYLDTQRLLRPGFHGLSWVAVWVPLFTVVVPTRPGRVALAAAASLGSVPIVIGFALATHPIGYAAEPLAFFFWHVFPYLLVGLLSYVGARIVYSLGREVTRARELGSYRLIERVAEGGMGEVWRAQHRLLARPAAIKLIRPSATTHYLPERLDGAPQAAMNGESEAHRRFEREAQVTACLRSPHTVDLFDFGITDEGTFYYVMELLDGFNLDALVKRFGPLPAERVVHVLQQLCHSLGEAHGFGLVHRDIKPANILVCRYGGDYDFVKVLDFGIVKSTMDALQTGLTVTNDNVLRGTPAFIAPEQALGNRDVDGRADIYAAGCVAYWLLTGQLVFSADSPIKVILDHAHTPPIPPSQRTEEPIPPALEAIVMACLAKDPAERPQSAKELAHRLSVLDHVNAWTDERAQEWWDLHQPESSS
jgi:serine/threonine-protein kinase